MTTIDTNGALHDAEGKYAHQHKPEAGYDLYVGFAEEQNNVSREDLYKFGAGLAIGGLALGGLAACTHEETPSVVDTGQPSISVTTPAATADPTETAPVEVTPVPSAVGQVLTSEEAKAPGAPPTYRTQDRQYVVISPDQPLPQAVQDDMAAAGSYPSFNAAQTQVHDAGVMGVYVIGYDIPGIGYRYTIHLTGHHPYSRSNPAPWSDNLSAHADGFTTPSEALEYAKSLQEQYPELGVKTLYDLTD